MRSFSNLVGFYLLFLPLKVTSSTCPPSSKTTGSSSERNTECSSFWTLCAFTTGEFHLHPNGLVCKKSHYSHHHGASDTLVVIVVSAASRKSSNKESDLSEDDVRTIRASLYGLVKYYISKGVSQEEMHSILGYVAAIGDEEQVRGQIPGRKEVPLYFHHKISLCVYCTASVFFMNFISLFICC